MVFRGKYMGNPIAAKQVHNSEEDMEDFEREVAMLTKLSHPCIMALFGVTKDVDGEVYMVLEYCGGGGECLFGIRMFVENIVVMCCSPTC
jgi:serine/threonine protein kinase